MSSNTQNPSVNIDAAGVLLGANTTRPGAHTGASEHIKLLHDRFPRMGNSAIANKVGCDESTVRDVIARYARNCSLENLRDFQANEADILDAVRERTVASISPQKLANATYLQLVTGAAILMDKSRLLKGQPTDIHVHALMDVAQLLREKREASGAATIAIGEPSDIG